MCRWGFGVKEWKDSYHEQLQQQHQQKQQAFEARSPWPACSCWAGAVPVVVPPATSSCCPDICLFRISILSDPMGCRRHQTTETHSQHCIHSTLLQSYLINKKNGGLLCNHEDMPGGEGFQSSRMFRFFTHHQVFWHFQVILGIAFI